MAAESQMGGWETCPRNKQAGVKRECSALNRRLSIEHPRGEQCRYVFDLCRFDCLKSSVLLSGGLDLTVRSTSARMRAYVCPPDSGRPGWSSNLIGHKVGRKVT